MILQTIKKGIRNDTFEESQVIQCFDVIIEKDMLQISNTESSDEELEIRQKNFNKAKELIGAAGLCRDNIIWYLGDPPLEKNVSLTVVTLDTVTLDTVTYVYSRIGIPDTMVFILNNSGKTISRVL